MMLAKKPKPDPRSWLPARTSPFGREVDVALQLVSRAALAAAEPMLVANLVSQVLVSDGLHSEFATDGIIAPNTAASLAAHDEQAILELCNELGAAQPCVNDFDPPYPKPVAATKLDAAALAAALERGSKAEALPPRTWVLAPITEAAQPAISLTLLEYGRPVVCAVALPSLPRNSMSGDKLLRMKVSYDGQSGAVTPPAGCLMWAEEGIGAYERSVGGEHGSDIRIRVDRCLIGRRSIAQGVATGVQDFSDVVRTEATAQLRAATLASQMGISKPVLCADGPFAYGLIARGEAHVYLEMPDDIHSFDSAIWSHAAGCLLVKEAGGDVTDQAGNPLDFSTCGSTRALGAHVIGIVATNKDLHPSVMLASGKAAAVAAMA